MGALVAMIKSTRILWVIIYLLLATTSITVRAATYNLTSGSYPPCNTSWSVSGTTYTCTGNGQVALASGDRLISNTTITIHADNGFSLSNNTIGSTTNRINLTSSYGAIQSANTNTIYGNISGGNSITLISTTVVGSISTGAAINLTGGSVSGSVTSSSNTITTSNTVIDGAVTANGDINMTGGSVAGLVRSIGNKITTNATNLSGGANAPSGMSITGGTLAGNFTTSNNPMILSGVTMTNGSISGSSMVTIQSGSTLGSSSTSITISSVSGPITVNASSVYGDLTAPNYSTVNITNGGAVYGTCTPNSTPANACSNTSTLVNHYRISHTGTGITCAAEPITIRAYNSLGNLVNPPNGTTITLSTLPATGTWSGGSSVTFNGSTDTAIKYLRQTTAAVLNINVSDGAKFESPTYDPNISFVNSALQFSRDNNFNPIDTQVAGVTNNNIMLRAIRTDNNTGACVAQTTGNRSVNLAYECRNPVSCIADQTLQLNSVTITKNNNNASINYQAVVLNFNASGIASIPFNYSDVGSIRMHAQLNLNPVVGNDPAITLYGNSGDFVVKPHTLAISSVTNLANVANPGTTNTGSGFVAAGEKFKVNIQSRNASGNITPNFGKETTPQVNNVVLTASSLVYPAGSNLATLGVSGTFSATTPTGTYVNSYVSWKQVGSMVISPALNNYLGADAVGNYVSSGTVGRFYPYEFRLSNLDTINTCSIDPPSVPTKQFLYMGKIFNIEDGNVETQGLKFTLTAVDVDGSTVSNYDLDYKGDGSTTTNDAYSIASIDFATFAGSSNLNSRLMDSSGLALTPGSWVKGIVDINKPSAQFGRAAIPDGPYTNVRVGLLVKDCLDKRLLKNANLTYDTTNSCSAPTNNGYELARFDARFGRLRLNDAFGPESASLPVSFTTEYWTGSFFTQNTNDNCTKILRSAITYPTGNILTPANLTVGLSGGNTMGNYSGLSATEIAFANGDARHFFSAPTGNATGSFNVDVDLTSYPWLRFDWDQNGVYADASLPTARFGFGSYRGNDRVIYWRERFQ